MQNAECGVRRPINGLSPSRKHSALCTPHSAVCTPRRRGAAATALIETAIVLPLYMILLFGLLYFGYATLGRQRQDKATAYAAWQSGTQDAGPLVGQFWGWTGALTPTATTPPAVLAGDTSFSVYGNSASEPWQWVRQGDEYYGATINGTLFVPCQLEGGLHSLYPGGGNDVFDSERVAVDLWNYALGATTQSFTWTPGVGLVQQFNTNYTSFANYLNLTPNPQGGLMYADAGHPPTPDLASPPGWGGLAAGALDGPPGGGQWLQRRAVESTMSYNPPFLRQAYADQYAPASTFSQYATGNYPAPANPLTTATMDCDVTLRNSATVRLGAEESPQTADALLAGVAEFLSQTPLMPPDWMDGLPLDSSATIKTIQGAWDPW